MTTDTVTSSPGDPWQLTYDDMPDEDFVDGLRLSTDCPARRLIEPLDPDRYHEFPEHLGHRGHGFERILQEWLLARFGLEAQREIVVPWEYGESHLDLFLPIGAPAFDVPRSLQIELKANKDAQVKPENVRQVHRQLYVVELAADAGKSLRLRVRDADGQWRWQRKDPSELLEAQWRVLVIDPSTWRIPDPRGVRVFLTDDRRRELDEEWAQIRAFMQLGSSVRKWNIETPTAMPACTCGKCFRPELRELDEECAEHASVYLDAQREVSFATAEQDLQRDWFLHRMAGQLPELEGGTFAGHGFAVTISKPHAKTGTRSVRVRQSDAKPTPMI
jgi:hypothetical protein